MWIEAGVDRECKRVHRRLGKNADNLKESGKTEPVAQRYRKTWVSSTFVYSVELGLEFIRNRGAVYLKTRPYNYWVSDGEEIGSSSVLHCL
jgi:hypothetical protein